MVVLARLIWVSGGVAGIRTQMNASSSPPYANTHNITIMAQRPFSMVCTNERQRRFMQVPPGESSVPSFLQRHLGKTPGVGNHNAITGALLGAPATQYQTHEDARAARMVVSFHGCSLHNNVAAKFTTITGMLWRLQRQPANAETGACQISSMESTVNVRVTGRNDPVEGCRLTITQQPSTVKRQGQSWLGNCTSATFGGNAVMSEGCTLRHMSGINGRRRKALFTLEKWPTSPMRPIFLHRLSTYNSHNTHGHKATHHAFSLFQTGSSQQQGNCKINKQSAAYNCPLTTMFTTNCKCSSLVLFHFSHIHTNTTHTPCKSKSAPTACSQTCHVKRVNNCHNNTSHHKSMLNNVFFFFFMLHTYTQVRRHAVGRDIHGEKNRDRDRGMKAGDRR